MTGKAELRYDWPIGTPADDVLDRILEKSAGAQPANTAAPTEAGATVETPHAESTHPDGMDAPQESEQESEHVSENAEPGTEPPTKRRGFGHGRIASWSWRAWQFFIAQTFSSVTRRIVSLNIAGLLAL